MTFESFYWYLHKTPVLCESYALFIYPHGIPCHVHLDVSSTGHGIYPYYLLQYSTMNYWVPVGDGGNLWFYPYHLPMIVWTVSILVGCGITSGICSGTFVLYWYKLCVYGTRFPMEHLHLLHYLVFLYSLNVDVFVHMSISMVTVPLLWTSTMLVGPLVLYRDSLTLTFLSGVGKRRNLYVTFMQALLNLSFFGFIIP